MLFNKTLKQVVDKSYNQTYFTLHVVNFYFNLIDNIEIFLAYFKNVS